MREVGPDHALFGLMPAVIDAPAAMGAKLFNPHPIGVTILMLPFFLAARALTLGLASLPVLRDPPWTGNILYGFYVPEAGDGGRPFRWTEGRASFFIPASASSVTIELGRHEVYNVTVTIAIDGRLADRLELQDEWKTVTLAMDARPTYRSFRRIDLSCNRVIGDDFQHGVRVRWRVD